MASAEPQIRVMRNKLPYSVKQVASLLRSFVSASLNNKTIKRTSKVGGLP